VTELAPGWSLVVEEATPNHWIATTRDLVLVVAYPGSSSDVRHVEATAKVIGRINRQRKERARLLFVLPEAGTAPASTLVRRAILDAAKGAEERVARATLVVPRAGFGAAVQRAVVVSVATIARWAVPHRITSDLGEALEFVLGPDQLVLAPLLQVCAERRQAQSGG
jgi:hypothetical protein